MVLVKIIINVLMVLIESFFVSLAVICSFFRYDLFGVELYHYPLFMICALAINHIGFLTITLFRSYLVRIKQTHRINALHLAYYFCATITTSILFVLSKVLLGTIWEKMRTALFNTHATIISFCLLRIVCLIISFLISTHINITQLLPQLVNNLRCEMVIKYILNNTTPNSTEENYLMNKKIVWKDIINKMVLDKESWGSKEKSEEDVQQKSQMLFNHLVEFQKWYLTRQQPENESFQIILPSSDTTINLLYQHEESDVIQPSQNQVLKRIVKKCFFEEQTAHWFDEMLKSDFIEIKDCVGAIKFVNEKKEMLKRKVRDKETISIVISHIIDIFGFITLFLIVCLINGVPVSTYLLPSCTFFLGFSFIFGDYMKRVWESLVLVIFVRPFDIGDRIRVTGFPTVIVDEIQLLNTISHNPNGEQYILPNDFLYKNVVTQLKRTTYYTIEIHLNVNIDTDFVKIEEIRKSLQNFVENDTTFEWGSVFFSPTDVTSQQKMNLLLWIEVNHVSYNEPGKYLKAKKMIIELLTKELIQRSVVFTLPKQPLIVDLKNEM